MRSKSTVVRYSTGCAGRVAAAGLLDQAALQQAGDGAESAATPRMRAISGRDTGPSVGDDGERLEGGLASSARVGRAFDSRAHAVGGARARRGTRSRRRPARGRRRERPRSGGRASASRARSTRSGGASARRRRARRR